MRKTECRQVRWSSPTAWTCALISVAYLLDFANQSSERCFTSLFLPISFYLTAWCFRFMSLNYRGPAIYVCGWLHISLIHQLLLFVLKKTWRVWVHHSSEIVISVKKLQSARAYKTMLMHACCCNLQECTTLSNELLLHQSCMYGVWRCVILNPWGYTKYLELHDLLTLKQW